MSRFVSSFEIKCEKKTNFAIDWLPRMEVLETIHVVKCVGIEMEEPLQ